MNGRLLAIMTLAAVLTWSAQWHWSQTIDEPQHLWAGLRIVQQWDFSRFDNSKMPVSSLNAVGWLLSQSPGVQGSWFWARAPQVVWLLGTVGLVFVWARRLGGARVALGAAALVALDPNLVAHAGLVTTDLPCTFAVLLACFTWVNFMEEPSPGRAVIAGAALGFAQVAKFTGLFLVPIVGIILILGCWLRRTTAPVRQLPLAVLAGLFSLNLCYGFSGTFTPANEVRWKSEPFSVLSTVTLPLPVPRPWIEGVDWVKHDDDQGQGRVYASGEKTHFGRPDHYLRTLPRKWPLPLMVLGLMGLAVGMRRRDQNRLQLLGVVVPPLFFLLWFSFAFNSQVGNRYLLPVVPFLGLWAAQLPARWLVAGAGWTLVSALSWWPWSLSYFNETVTDRSQAWRIVADSDLDWGQTDAVAKEWLVLHPDGRVDPDVPAPGDVLLSANRLTGVLGHPAMMACYREHLPPTTHLAGALYPLSHVAGDFASCFPVVDVVEGTGLLPAGEHLLLIRFRGTASLRVGEHIEQSSSDDEALLGLVVKARTSFTPDWTLPEGASVYLNGVVIAGAERP